MKEKTRLYKPGKETEKKLYRTKLKDFRRYQAWSFHAYEGTQKKIYFGLQARTESVHIFGSEMKRTEKKMHRNPTLIC